MLVRHLVVGIHAFHYTPPANCPLGSVRLCQKQNSASRVPSSLLIISRPPCNPLPPLFVSPYRAGLPGPGAGGETACHQGPEQALGTGAAFPGHGAQHQRQAAQERTLLKMDAGGLLRPAGGCFFSPVPFTPCPSNDAAPPCTSVSHDLQVPCVGYENRGKGREG